ncbi:MAG: ATP-binding protein, partial [Nocardioides sp.]
GEARVRSQVGGMLVTLSWRNNSLINQQLGLIETLEKDEEDPQRLESLFRLDHLASRMRRTAESLMILADAPTQARDHGRLSVADALHAATAGVQDYQRVQILAAPTEQLSTAAAPDVVHLVTELVDNALSYSPPTAPVLVVPTSSPAGVVLQISDGGLGIPEDVLAGINEDLRSGGEVTPDTARRMGLLVVSRLARRHGISIRLDHNDRRGTTATVILPPSILSGGEASVADPAESPVSLTVVPEPVQPAAAPAPEVADEAPPAPGLDRIEAAINAAVMGLPQREPGTSGAPVPARATVPQRGSLGQRLSAREDRRAAADPVAAPSPPLSPELVVEADPTPVVAPVPTAPPAPVASVAVPAPRGVLDAETHLPDAADDETPIFKGMRSNWLSSPDSPEKPWASSEVEAGWQAADRVAETPAPQLSEVGLPMRRPGNRLVPGGVAKAATPIVRDPEAIRARLAAHAAGVSRGRTAVVTPVPADTHEEAGHA